LSIVVLQALMLGAALLVGSCALFDDDDGDDVAYLTSPATSSLNLPFSEAVRVGELLFVSGQIGNRPGTLELVPGGIRAETQQVLDNLQAILERNGSSLERVVKCQVFLADIAEWPVVNEIYRTFFTRNLPARSALGANGLALGARVEIECIATVDVR
jgi:reactive intermediate/imine deaminase